MKHHPEILSGGRHGVWCNCSCGWRSDLYMAVPGAHLAFGEHLLATAAPTTDVLPTLPVTTTIPIGVGQ